MVQQCNWYTRFGIDSEADILAVVKQPPVVAFYCLVFFVVQELIAI